MTKEELFRDGIIPLYDPKRKLALLWSAKAGCTTAVKWFFQLMGLLDDAVAYDGRWIHRYRMDVYYKSKNFQDGLLDILNGDYVFIKMVRNPYDRAVSSFLHAMKHKFVHDDLNRLLSKDTPREAFTFREFVTYLEGIDIATCNAHHRQQVHPLEGKGLIELDHLVKIENFEEDLRTVEKELGLPATDFSRISSSHHHTNRVQDPLGLCVSDRPFFKNKAETRLPLPENDLFYTPDLATKIYKIYQKDFETYTYYESLPMPSTTP